MPASGEDMARAATLPSISPGAVTATLRVEVNDNRASTTTTSPVTLIGSRRDCHLSVSHPDVSKVHCAIVHTGRAMLLVDLRSRAGTYVNDLPIRLVPLRPGDNVRIGSVPLDISFENWTDDLAEAAEAAMHMDPPAKLEAEGQEIEVTINGAVIGRRNNCDVVVDDTDASLAHAVLFKLDDRLALADLGSRSGTFVNAQQTTLAWLNAGDRVRVGKWEFAMPGGSPDAAQVATPNNEVAEPALPESPVPPAAPLVFEQTGHHDKDLVDLETSIATLHAQVATAQTALTERTQQLDATQRAIEAKQAELGQQAADFQRQRDGLAAQLAEVAQQGAALQQREAELQQKIAEIEQTQLTLSNLETELAARDANLAQREQAIVKREENEAQVSRKMEHFKAALRQASQAFSTLTSESDAGAPDPSRAAAQDGGNGLPAPLVQQPMFQTPPQPQPPTG